MDKYEYKIRADEIKEMIAQGEYAQAAEIADTIDWRRVKSVMMLCTISDLYKINRRYEDARDMLLLAYERRPGGRTICYSLCELSIKMEEFLQAVEYYKEFVQIAPRDPGRYILQYKLYEAQDVSLEERIEVLEELKKRDYREKWAYELAYLYHRVGLATRCVEECDELILWFGEGKYVIKAMELKMLHQPLTSEQQEKYDHRFEPEPAGEVQDYPDTQEYEEAQGYENADGYPEEESYPPAEDYPAEDEPPSEGEEETGRQQENIDIQVKTMDVGQYNTINLQEELAAGLREVLGDEPAKETSGDSLHYVNPEPEVQEADILEEDEPAENIWETESREGVSAEDIREIAGPREEREVRQSWDERTPAGEAPADNTLRREEIESSEVFFGETGELGHILEEPDGSEISLEKNETKTEDAVDVTGETVLEQMRKESAETVFQEAFQAQPPRELASVLSQETDGQISLVMPESEPLEKQITGQMNIQDVLAEWEQMKKENQEKRREEVRLHVLQQTGNMFTEFEASVREGLLEQLESGNAPGVFGTEDEFTQEPLPEYGDTQEESFQETFQEAVPEETAEKFSEAEEEGAEFTEELEASETSEVLQAFEESGDFEESEELGQPDISAHGEAQGRERDDVPKKEPSGSRIEVERDKARVRNLTREEKELYAPFIQSKTARQQLVKVIDGISLAAYTGNVILTGEEGMDTLTLAKNMIREVQITDSNFSGKVAKISGQALNRRNVEEILLGLKNGALIIQKASGINEETAAALFKALQQESMGIIVILEDTKKSMDKLLSAQKRLSACFTCRMDVEALSNDTLVAFGRQYAREREYSIDELGVLALHTRIEDMQTIDHVVTVLEVKEIVDEAIRHANRKTPGHFLDILFARRYDDEDMIILTEQDFS